MKGLIQILPALKGRKRTRINGTRAIESRLEEKFPIMVPHITVVKPQHNSRFQPVIHGSGDKETVKWRLEKAGHTDIRYSGKDRGYYY